MPADSWTCAACGAESDRCYRCSECGHPLGGPAGVGSSSADGGATKQDYKQFPNVRKEFGEDPAQWLHKDDAWVMIGPLIRGMQDPARIRAWIAVERNLWDGGRDEVIDPLEAQLAIVESKAERLSAKAAKGEVATDGGER